jgi:hypothetical protein
MWYYDVHFPSIDAYDGNEQRTFATIWLMNPMGVNLFTVDSLGLRLLMEFAEPNT